MKVMSNMSIYQNQRGFTIIELMISLVLGLLIMAAVLQVYMTMVRTKTIQKGGSEITDVSVFGVQDIEQALRMANLGNPVSNITYTTPGGGIVLSSTNLPGVLDNQITNSEGAAVSPNVSMGVPAVPAWAGISKTNIKSDQLTIQYRNITGREILNCESQAVPIDGVVVQRYFLREPTSNPTGSAGLVLACDAGTVAGGVVTGLGGSGTEQILNVDQFKVMLGVQTPTGIMSYIPPHEYLALQKTSTLYRAPIVAIKVGMIVRASTPIVGEITPPTQFTVLGKSNTISNTTTKYVRKVYESTSMLRNARLITVATSEAREL